YLIQEDQRWNSASIYRIDGNSIHPAHVNLPGSVPEYLGRWRLLCLGIPVAWLLHHGILICGVSILAGRQIRCHHRFGVQQAEIGSIWRRGLGCGIDLSIGITLLVLFACLLLGPPQFDWKAWESKTLCNSLVEFERELDTSIRGGSLTSTLNG